MEVMRQRAESASGRPASEAAKDTGRPRIPALPLQLDSLRPGLRVAIAVSGGADSVALLRAMILAAAPLGLVLSVAHVHHGIRGQEADLDAGFVALLADRLGLRFDHTNVDTPKVARQHGTGLEEAARTLRYGWFAELLGSKRVDAVATAHTLNDQAETVLHRLLRGGWTEGLAGIYPKIALGGAKAGAATGGAADAERGIIVRPMLGVSREQVVDWLGAIGQPWREDATNADMAYTRNRLRHQLLPELATYNPRLTHQLAHLATIAREEEAYWQKEMDRLLPGLLLPGRAVRGGGRASSTSPGERALAIEVERLRGLDPALVRRLLRAAARQLGATLDFEQTARLTALAAERGTANPRREELTAELRAERTPRELRLLFSARSANPSAASRGESIQIPVPGEGQGLGWRVRCSLADGQPAEAEPALLRVALPGDRVQLRYTRGSPKRIKEVLERMGVEAQDRAHWPLLIWRGEIVWLRGAVLEPTALSKLLLVDATPI